METPKACRVTSPSTRRVTTTSPVMVSSKSPNVNVNGNENNRTTFIPIASPYIDQSTSNSSTSRQQLQQRRPRTVTQKKSHDCSIVSGITTKCSSMSYPTNLQAADGGGSIDSTDVESSEWGDDSNSSTIQTAQSYICPQTTSERQNGGVVHTDLQAYYRATTATPSIMSEDGSGSRHSTGSKASSHGHAQNYGPNVESTLVVVTESGRRRLLLAAHKPARRKCDNELTPSCNYDSVHYSPFHQPISHDDATPAHAAVRNLASSTSIQIPINVMNRGSVGTMYYSYTDETTENMRSETLHLFHVDLVTAATATNAPIGATINQNVNSLKKRRRRESTFIGAKRIERPTDNNGNMTRMAPKWINDWDLVPLDMMHPTDASWLTTLVEGLEDTKDRVTFDAWFQCLTPTLYTDGYTHIRGHQYGGYADKNGHTNTRVLHSFLSMTDQNDDDENSINTPPTDAATDQILYGIHVPAMDASPKSPAMATTTRKPKPVRVTVDMSQQPSVTHKTPLKQTLKPVSATTNPSTITATNSTPIKMTLEERLFHALHNKNSSLTISTPHIPKPSKKEFKEAWSFANTTHSFYKNESIDLVLDVAGGHGTIAALFLALTDAKKAVVIDPADVGGGSVQECWGEFYKGKSLEFRQEYPQTGLRTELDRVLMPLLQRRNAAGMDPKRILVVACNTNQHLADETLEIACSYGVNVTVMPCCKKDPTDRSSFEEFSKQVGIDISMLMDILTAGKAMSWNNGQDADVQYQVRMKTIDEPNTPQNRLILCKASERAKSGHEVKRVQDAHRRYETAYKRAHGNKGHQQLPEIIEVENMPPDHREQGVRLSIMKFAKRMLRKSSREGTSGMNVVVEECESINKDIDGQTASVFDTLLWKNLPLLSLLNFAKKSYNEHVVELGTENIGDIGNPVHGVAAVKHIQDTLSTETMAAAGIFFVGSILSVILSPSFSQNR